MQNTMGGIQETLGKVTGSENLKTSGQERRAQGDAEYKEGQAQGYTEGTKDRLVGKKDQLSGAVTGDTSQEASGKFYLLPGSSLIGRTAHSQACASLQAAPATRRARPSKTGTSRKLLPPTCTYCSCSCKNTSVLVTIPFANRARA